jgi:hypothetical protein
MKYLFKGKTREEFAREMEQQGQQILTLLQHALAVAEPETPAK